MLLEGQTVLITGGSSGIGLELARGFSSRGCRVVVCGRTRARLDAAERELENTTAVACDLSREDERERLFSTMRERFPELAILVNNAAMLQYYELGTTPSTSPSAAEEISTNLTAVIELTTLFLPILKTRPHAALVNISSAVAYTPLATAPVYSATKAALHSFSQSLRWQLRETPVRVFEVFPPSTDTPLIRRLETGKLSPADVATRTLRGLERDREELRIGKASLLHWLSRIAPGFALTATNRLVRVKPEGQEEEARAERIGGAPGRM